MNMLANSFVSQVRTPEEGSASRHAPKTVGDDIFTYRRLWESNMRNAAYYRNLGNLKAARSHVNQATGCRLMIESLREDGGLHLAAATRFNAADMPLSGTDHRQRPAVSAANDAADRLLVTFKASESPDYFSATYTAMKWAERAVDMAIELCDFAALAGEEPADLLLEAAQIYRGDPERRSSVADALSLVEWLANRGAVA